VDAKVYTLPKLHQSSRILQSQQTKESLLLGPPIAPTILPRKSQVPISRATVQVLFLRFHISGKRVIRPSDSRLLENIQLLSRMWRVF
jgi:hypothetical protein